MGFPNILKKSGVLSGIVKRPHVYLQSNFYMLFFILKLPFRHEYEMSMPLTHRIKHVQKTFYFIVWFLIIFQHDSNLC